MWILLINWGQLGSLGMFYWTNNQQKYRLSFNKTSLTYFCPVFPFYTSLKKSKNLGLSDAFRGYKQGTPDINGLKLPINYLLDNCYFTLGSMRYCQLTWITMGSNTGPFVPVFSLLWKVVACLNNRTVPAKS